MAKRSELDGCCEANDFFRHSAASYIGSWPPGDLPANQWCAARAGRTDEGGDSPAALARAVSGSFSSSILLFRRFRLRRKLQQICFVHGVMKPLYLLGLINVRRAYFRGGSSYSYCDEAANVVAAVVSDGTDFRFALFARITSISLLFRGNSVRTFSPVTKLWSNSGPLRPLSNETTCFVSRCLRPNIFGLHQIMTHVWIITTYYW